ncbi:late blight resistance protein R1-A-like [Coffea arabica]|uniref:Late blight resistance protein R1-A-like n=1 Tax=Coffea arabica TaxID=13443 RepID=A0A6P6WSH1_COFAR|nr:putative disease resistance RPP13-like protein 3 [Coffea arabica]
MEKDVNYIVNRAADFVQEWMIDNSIVSEMRYLIETLVHKCTEKSPDRKINLEAAIKSSFDGERGIHHYFLHISGEIRSIRRKIRRIRGINGTTLSLKTLQLESNLPLKGHSLADSNLRNIVVGFDADLMKIMDRLARPSLGREVLAIVGMGGIGKTTLARQMFDHPDTAFQFHCRAWITVSQVGSTWLLWMMYGVMRPGIVSKCVFQTTKMSKAGNRWKNLFLDLKVGPLELVDLGKQIARKCHGLPLAIVVIAGTLSRTVMTSDCWKDFAASVNSVVLTNPEQCSDILALSYNYLPLCLKICFLYMGAFPEDYEIEVQKLIRLWIAEGFLKASSSNNPEDVAEDYLEDLTDRSLVLVGKRNVVGKIKTCRLHDLLRELCLREAQKRTSCFVPDIFFSYLKFHYLRVLDMFFLQFDSFPAQIIKLQKLRYLALNVTYKLPTELDRLRHLQTLVINGPWPLREDGGIPTLTVRYWNMPKLRHLRITMVAFLSYLTDAASNTYRQPLSSGYLKTLSTVRFLSCRRDAFAMMPNLTELGMCETEEDYYRDRSCECLKNLAYLHQLETLTVPFTEKSEKQGL